MTAADVNKNILEVKSLTKRFGGLKALAQVDFEAEEGQVTALIGPNGAGKTTCLNVISGIYRSTSGRIVFGGEDITECKSHQIAGKGLTRTFQNLQVFTNMTVLENVMVGLHAKSSTGFLSAMFRTPQRNRDEKMIREKAMESLKFFDLDAKADWDGSALAYGDQKRVEMARAMAASPELLLLDEPAAGLNTRETEDMGDLINRIKERGTSVILVEHDMDLVMGASDSVAVLCYGEKIAQGSPREIQNDPQVISAYLGEPGN